jgi:hypothetical protein
MHGDKSMDVRAMFNKILQPSNLSVLSDLIDKTFKETIAKIKLLIQESKEKDSDGCIELEMTEILDRTFNILSSRIMFGDHQHISKELQGVTKKIEEVLNLCYI